MFSGIVAAMGRIVQIENRDQGLRLRIETGGLDLSDVAVGDSIAVNGVCLTAVGVTP
ncbi:MAG TPA: riboflavin synthase, partial [Burkholderiales bacterium]|nr:riboflavin synthase [Burkholderiales bacterium]